MTSYFGHPGLGHVMPINVDVTCGTDVGIARFPIVANSIAKVGNIQRCSVFELGLPPWNHVSGIRSTALSRTLVAVYHYTPLTSKTSRTALLPSRLASMTGRTQSHRHQPTSWKSRLGSTLWSPTSMSQSASKDARCNTVIPHQEGIALPIETTPHIGEILSCHPRHQPTMLNHTHHRDSAPAHLLVLDNLLAQRTCDPALFRLPHQALRSFLVPRPRQQINKDLNALPHH